MKAIDLPKCTPTLSWNCMDWSANGTLAIAVSDFVYIIYSQNLPSLNLKLENNNFFVRKLDPVSISREFTFSIPDERVGSSAFFAENAIISVFWSDLDITSQVSPYLAALTKDRNCFIYEQFEKFDGLSWKIKYDMFALLAQLFVDPDANEISQNELNKIKIGSFSWVEKGKLFGYLFLIGNYRGDILFGKFTNDGKVEIITEMPSMEIDVSIWNIKSGNWIFHAESKEYKLPILYTLSDNSVWLTNLCHSTEDDTFNFAEPIGVLSKSEIVITTFELYNSLNHGTFVISATCLEANIFFLNSMTNHKFEFPVFGDYKPIFSEGHSKLQILFCNSNIDSEMITNPADDNPWLFGIDVDETNGCQKKEIGTSDISIFVDAMSTFVKNENIVLNNSLVFRIYSICSNRDNHSVAFSYNIFDPHFMSPIRIGEVVTSVKFLPTVQKVKSNTLKSIVNINEWLSKKGTSDNWLIEKHTLMAQMIEDIDMSNFTTVEAFDNIIQECLKFEMPDFIFTDDDHDFHQVFARNADEFFREKNQAGIILKKLKLFYLLVHYPEKPFYSLKELVSETKRREDLEFYELNRKMYYEMKKKIIRKIYYLTCCLIYKHIQHFKPVLENEFDKVIKYTAEAECRSDIAADEILGTVVLPIYEGIMNLSFEICKINSASDHLIDSKKNSWKRCSKSLLPVLTPDVLSCNVCESNSVIADHFKSSILVPILVNSNNLCIHCDGAMYKRS